MILYQIVQFSMESGKIKDLDILSEMKEYVRLP